MHPNQIQSDPKTIYPYEKSGPISAPLELTADLRYILGLPHSRLAITVQQLRHLGHCIGERSEDEQASVVHWMLGHYLRHGLHWRLFAYREININDDFLGFPGDEALSEDATEQECPKCSAMTFGSCDDCYAARGGV